MTREEQIRQVGSAYAIDEVKDTCNPRGLLYAGFIDGAEWADTHPHWISVEDELPPKNEAYLAFWQHLGVTKYRYVKAGAKVSRTFSEHITHWMPLPSVEYLKEKKL